MVWAVQSCSLQVKTPKEQNHNPEYFCEESGDPKVGKAVVQKIIPEGMVIHKLNWTEKFLTYSPYFFLWQKPQTYCNIRNSGKRLVKNYDSFANFNNNNNNNTSYKDK